MNLHILLIFISILVTLIAAYLASESGEEYWAKFRSWLGDFIPELADRSERKSSSLVSQIFYGYRHSDIDEWKAWISSQDKGIQREAFNLLKEHLEGEPQYWGNISTEVLEGLLAFRDFKVPDFLHKFLMRISTMWNEYIIVPSLYEKGINLLFKLDPNRALDFMYSEFTQLKIESDGSFQQKAELIISLISEDQQYAAEFYADILNNEKVPTKIIDKVLREVLNLAENPKKLVFKKIFTAYVQDRDKIKQKTSESPESYENRLAVLKKIIEEAINLISSPEMFSALSQLIEIRELARIVHNKVLGIINNSATDLTFNQLLAFNYLPDTEDNKIKQSLASKRGLPQLQVREIVTKPRIRGEEIEPAILNHKKMLPIPSCQEKIFKPLLQKLGQDKNEILNGEKINSIALLGNDRLRKAYFCASIAKKAGIVLNIIDCKTLKSETDFLFAQKKIEKSEGLLFIDNIDAFIHCDDDDHFLLVNNFLNDLKETLKKNKYRGILSFRYSQEQIEKDLKLQIFYGKHIKPVICDYFEVHNSKAYKDEISDHYIKFLKQEKEEFMKFFEEFNSSRLFSNELDYEFSCIDELSTQLLVFGEPRSFTEIDELRRDLFGQNLLVS